MQTTTDEKVIAIDAAAMLPLAAGGKARGLLELVRSGLSVPPAWVILPGATAMQIATLATGLAAKGIARIAVRSSATDEDGGQHSFAGIHETMLAVPLEQLPRAMERVAASPETPRAAAYRRQRGLPAAKGPCAVIVQEMVDAEWAGVAFGKGNSILVEAVEGLGEAAVNGDATPEQIEFLRIGESVQATRRWPRRQPAAVRPGQDGVRRVDLVGPPPPCPGGLALEVAQGVAVLEKAQGRPLDLEWAAREGKVTFLQARAQTRPLEAGLPPGEKWTRTNVSDIFPDIPSAYIRSYMVAALDRLMHRVDAQLGGHLSDGIPLAAVVAGRLVFNERALYGYGDIFGVPRSWSRLIMGGAGGGNNAYVRPPLWKLIRRIGILVRMSRFARGAEAGARAHIELLQRRIVEDEAGSFGAFDPQAVIALRPRWTEELDQGALEVVWVALAFQQALSEGAMILKKLPAPATLLARLLDPELVSVSTRQLEEQVELARALRRWDGARPFLVEIGPDHAERAFWRRALPGDLWAQVERWLETYGHRGPYESDPAQPRYADDLRLLATALRPLVTSAEEPESIAARRARRRVDWAAAWSEVATQVGVFGRRALRGPVRRLGRLMQVREELRSTLVRRGMLPRTLVNKAAESLVAKGRLAKADEIYLLEFDDLERAVLDPAFDMLAAVARERARLAAWRRIDVPDHFTSEEVATFTRGDATLATTATMLHGTAVSPGVVEGPACLLRTPDDERKMVPGGVLVTHATDPGWTPIFARAAGVVVELGGVLSHSATVAREFGLPCVSNVEGAMAKLRDGDVLRLDGNHGTVEIMERAHSKDCSLRFVAGKGSD